MPAKSKNQRMAAGMARAMQKGEIPMTPDTAAGQMSLMAPGSLREFAKTPEAGLPQRVRGMGAKQGQRKPQGRTHKKGCRRSG